MKVYVQVINITNGIYQQGMIDEPIKKGLEVSNALGHFGVDINTVEWTSTDATEDYESKFGAIKDTTKVVTVTSLLNS
jgi:hypothetical protein